MVSRKQGASRGSRTGIEKRRAAIRGDKDGDVSMDTASRAKGGITKRTSTGNPEANARRGRSNVNGAARLKAEVMRAVKSGDVATKGRGGPSQQQLEDIVITGWTDLLTSSDESSLVPAIVTFVERKATLKSPTKRPVKVKKSQVQDGKLILTIYAGDAGAVLRLDGYVFGKLKKVNLKFVRASKAEDNSKVKEDTIAMMKSVLHKRYNLDMKLLDLSALGQDPDLKAAAIFDSKSTASKFFPALMKILDQQFKDSAEKHDAILSVTLANNALPDLSVVTTLSQTLPQLRNLDLSNNNFSKIADIEVWKKRFSKLDHLVISGNPIEQADPNLAKTLMDWFPRLRMINSVQVRSDEEAAKGTPVNLPFPILAPVFQDEGQIAETFIRNFFAGFDSDRAALARMYYDSASDFSFAVNTGAPRDPNATDQPVPQEWDAWIKQSRNLKKLNHLPARQARLFKGADAVIDSWTHLPATRHPDLAAEAHKWLIECQTQPGVPNPTQPASGGVDGFLITIHGEFDEMDVSTGQPKKKRSFDRTFILGPGGPSGVRIVNDMLTVRAYGGTQAFQPEAPPTNSQPAPAAAVPQGLTPEVANNLVIELQKQTGMTADYAKDCLTQVSWDLGQAMQAFEQVKASLPPTAFVQPPAA